MSGMPQKYKRCTSCLEPKPLTLEYYSLRGETDREPGAWRSACRSCENERRRRSKSKDMSRRADPLAQRESEPICGECHNLSWRVAGPKCPECGIRYASEPPPALENYLYQDRWRVTA